MTVRNRILLGHRIKFIYKSHAHKRVVDEFERVNFLLGVKYLVLGLKFNKINEVITKCLISDKIY